MENSDDVLLAWGDFQNNIINRLKHYINQKNLSDITLVTKDNKKIPSHKLILSSGSKFFSALFAEDFGHQHSLVYLNGVDYDILVAIIQFLYQGQVQLRREQVDEFLAMAQDLGVEGLEKEMEQGTKPSVDDVSSGSI